MPLYQVIDWDDHFEGAKSKKYKNKTTCQMPTKHGLGYRRLVRKKDGPAMFGAWCALIQILSRQPVPRQGYLTDTGGDQGQPLDSEDLELLCDIPSAIFDQMFKACTEPKIGWLAQVGKVRGYHADTTGISQGYSNSDLDLDSNLDSNLDSTSDDPTTDDGQARQKETKENEEKPPEDKKPKADKKKPRPPRPSEIHDKAVKNVVFPEIYDDNMESLFYAFADNRRSSRKYFTENAVEMHFKKLEPFSREEIIRAYHDAIEGNYQGIFPKKEPTKHNHVPVQNQPLATVEEMIEQDDTRVDENGNIVLPF